MLRKTARLARDVWALAHPYWFSEERWSARGLLLIIIVLNLGIVGLEVLFNDFNRRFYNALQEYDAAAFLPLLARFTVIAVVWIVAVAYRLWLRQMLEMRWRRWMTDRYVERWLAGRHYYRLQLEGGATDNPDQRIADDMRLFTENTLILSIGFMDAVVTLASFATILWSLSGSVTIPLGDFAVTIPGYMLWAAILYYLIGTWITHGIGRRLIPLNFQRQRYEADFRFSLARFRENVESIALYGGEPREQRAFGARFAAIMANWWELIRRQKRLTFFTSGFGQVAVIFPLIMQAPRYFAREIELGQLTQTAGAFNQVQNALSWFVDNYPALAEWKATVDRLTTFTAAIERIETDATAKPGIVVTPVPARDIRTVALDLGLPTGQILLPKLALTLRAGEATLLSGPSGSGKSTLFRALAGIWPYGSGTIERPEGARILFLPQRPYLPIDTLRAVLTYPAVRDDVGDDELKAVLEAVDLPQLASRLDEHAHWAQALSPGEQQRIAFARAFLAKPDWLFLDEASAALDEAVETRLYQALPKRLPDTTVVSIGHRPSLRAFHARHLEIRPAGDHWTIADVPKRAVAE